SSHGPVILSAVNASRSEAFTESKDPVASGLGRTRKGVLTKSTALWELPYTPVSAQAEKGSFDSVGWFASRTNSLRSG
ncbi:MAG: hypothetical protein WCA49_17380, partial [Candidatus Sulfotelmatobacter sp.]